MEKYDIKVLFIGNKSSTFVRRDFEILSKHFHVESIEPPKSKNNWLNYFNNVKELVKKSDIVFGWFAGWHTLPGVHYGKRYGKKSVIVVGGYDVVSFPEIRYGAFSNFKESFASKYVLKNANLILPVSNFLEKEIIKRVEKLGGKIEVLPTGYDSEFWKPRGEKEKLVLTVASAKTLKRVKIKGIDIFVNVAKFLPDTKFLVIGAEGEAKEYIKRLASENVEILGFVPHKKLLPYYQRAKVYAQLSISEGLPNTLCEAMLCGCIPVGSERGGIPEVMGDIGFYVPYGNIEKTADAIKKALNTSEDRGFQARKRIVQLFPLKNREVKLIDLIRGMV